MSAFIVSHDHIDAILTYAIQRRMSYWNPELHTRPTIDRASATEIGRILLEECERSVSYRYPGDSPDQLPGKIGERAASYAYRAYFHMAPTPGGQLRACGSLNAVQCIKAVNCLEYQSCEHPGWEASLAHRICQDIKAAAVHDLPGYDAAEWEINRKVMA